MFGLSPLWLTVAKYAAIVFVCIGVGATGGYKWEKSALDDLKLEDAKAQQQALAQAVAKQQAQDQKTHDADVAYAQSQQKTVTVTQEVIRDVPKYITVKDDAACKLPDSFGRLLDAAQLGVSPDSLPDSASKPDGTATTLTLSQATGLLAQILGDYASVRARLVNANAAWAAQAAK